MPNQPENQPLEPAPIASAHSDSALPPIATQQALTGQLVSRCSAILIAILAVVAFGFFMLLNHNGFTLLPKPPYESYAPSTASINTTTF